jgi:two-component system sensor histidine kinase QseC
VKSIRFYLIFSLLAAVTLSNFVAAVYGYRNSMTETEALLDAQLADAAVLMQTMLPGREDLSRAPSERLAFQIWTADRQLVQRSENSSQGPITDLEEGYRDENFAGHRWRVLSTFDEKSKLWFLIAERIDIRIDLADEIILQALIPIILSLPLIAVIVWLVVSNGFSVVASLATELRGKKADDLSQLVTSDPPVELAPVIDALNGLLRRLDESINRERRFSADAAHELRTPISALIVHVHNLRQQFPDKAPELAGLDRDLSRLRHLIEQILTLYRVAPEHYQAAMRSINLHALAQSVIADLYEKVEEKHQTIALHGTAQTIVGDDPSLRIMLTNLILNACKYSPDGASITVTVDRGDLGVCLSVKDTGPGIPLTEINQVFDRFHRVGGDRHGSSVEGCGLGLSIVKHITSLHYANISLQNNDDGPGLTASVIFPVDWRTAMNPEEIRH